MDSMLFDPSDLALVLDELNELNSDKDITIDETLSIEMEAAQKRVDDYILKDNG